MLLNNWDPFLLLSSMTVFHSLEVWLSSLGNSCDILPNDTQIIRCLLEINFYNYWCSNGVRVWTNWSFTVNNFCKILKQKTNKKWSTFCVLNRHKLMVWKPNTTPEFMYWSAYPPKWINCLQQNTSFKFQ